MTNIDSLADAISEQMRQYTSEVEEDAIPPIVDATADALAEEISRKAPRRSGKYANGWAVRKLSERVASSDGYAKLVCNPKRYYLTHLLEHGHAKRGGGRVSGKPHINPACDKHLAAFEEKVQEAVKR